MYLKIPGAMSINTVLSAVNENMKKHLVTLLLLYVMLAFELELHLEPAHAYVLPLPLLMILPEFMECRKESMCFLSVFSKRHRTLWPSC